MPKRCRSLATALGILSGAVSLIALIGLVIAFLIPSRGATAGRT